MTRRKRGTGMIIFGIFFVMIAAFQLADKNIVSGIIIGALSAAMIAIGIKRANLAQKADEAERIVVEETIERDRLRRMNADAALVAEVRAKQTLHAADDTQTLMTEYLAIKKEHEAMAARVAELEKKLAGSEIGGS